MRHARAGAHGDAAGATPLEKLVAQPRLSRSRPPPSPQPPGRRRRGRAGALSRAAPSPRRARRTSRDRATASDRAACACGQHPRARPRARACRPLHLHRPEIAQREVPVDDLDGARREQRLPRLGERFHPLRQADGVSLRRVLHAQVVADPPHYDLTRIEAHAHREVEPLLVTCLRSPSSADFDCRIFSARCVGGPTTVVRARSAGAGMGAAAGRAHCGQNFAPAGSSARHPAHRTASGAAQCMQKRALAGESRWHPEQCMRSVNYYAGRQTRYSTPDPGRTRPSPTKNVVLTHAYRGSPVSIRGFVKKYWSP